MKLSLFEYYSGDSRKIRVKKEQQIFENTANSLKPSHSMVEKAIRLVCNEAATELNF